MRNQDKPIITKGGPPEWSRQSQSANNFDLLLVHPQELNSERVLELLDQITAETHRGLRLNGRATREFRRWVQQPDTPLKSEAYVLLSNWFCTNSGDRRSTVASRCEALWDELFPSRPAQRLSSPAPGKNHAVVSAGFDTWWRSVLKAQGHDFAIAMPDDTGEPSQYQSTKPLTIADAKASLARSFGVSPDKIEITIRG